MSIGTPQQSRTFTDPAGYGARLLTFERFNPALGTLDGLRLGITGHPAGRFAVENLEAGVSVTQVSYLTIASINVFAPGGTLLAEGGWPASAYALLPTFDGTVDFAGPSGVQASAGETGQVRVTNLAAAERDLSAFIGTGTVDLAVSDVVRNDVTGSANMRVRADASAGGDVTLAYDYTPPRGGGGDFGFAVTAFINNTTVIRNNTIFDVVFVGPRPVTVTTAPQVFRLDTRTTGWRDQIAVAPFDPALGTLSVVHLRLATTLDAKAAVENHTNAASAAHIRQSVTTTLSRGDAGITAQTLESTGWLGFGAADGIDDFAGSGGAPDGGRHVASVKLATLGTAEALQAFSGAQPVAVSVATSSAGSINATGNWLAEMTAMSGAVVEVAYTYFVDASQSSVLVDDTTSGTGETVSAQAYAGPVVTLQHEYINITPDNLNIAATTDNWFIRTGDGTDAIAVRGGTNVLDGGGGSNFLTGGFGQDTFFVDTRGSTADIWSTIANFQFGDAATLWGVTPEAFALNWFDNEGATGAQGLTLHASAAGRPMTSLTLQGYSTTDLTNGALIASFGRSEAVDYLYLRAA